MLLSYCSVIIALMSTYYLNYRGIVQVSGKDAPGFLQNLTSNDIKKLEEKKLIYSLLLSPQGKILYDFFIFRLGDDFYLDCHKEYAQEIVRKLSAYILRSDVKVESQPHFLVYVSQDQLTPYCYADPRNSEIGFRGYATSINELAKFALEDEVLDEYTKKRLMLLIPEFGCDFTSGEFFALDLGMDKINAVSFNKGCYVGQEVTARMNYRGKNKKCLAMIDLEDFEIKGREIFKEQKKAGVLLKAYQNKALALMKNDAYGSVEIEEL